MLDTGSKLTLHLSFSPSLQPLESYVAATINDIHIGTVRISTASTDQWVTFDLPAGAINETVTGKRPQRLLLRLEVANHLPETACEALNPEVAWTRVFADSYFTTQYIYQTLPDLQAYPYPFVSDTRSTSTTLVIPDDPTGAELGAALSTVATLGRFAPGRADIRMVSTSDATADRVRDTHLIVMGTRARQPLVDDLLSQMTDVPGYRDEPGLYRLLSDDETGLLREAPSPWNKERVVLLVFAQTDSGFEAASSALFNAAPPVQQPGSVALVRAGEEPAIIYRSNETPPSVKGEEIFSEPLLPRPEPWIVTTGVLVIAAVVVFVTVWVSSWRGGRQG